MKGPTFRQAMLATAAYLVQVRNVWREWARAQAGVKPPAR